MSILIAILIFGLVIIVHELGHFLIAKRSKITVLDFSVGMGPKIWGITYHGTEYNLRLFPIGGACNMLDEDDVGTAPGSFHNAKLKNRAATIFAGPFFNFLLAFVLSIFVVMLQGYNEAMLGEIDQRSPAYEAGLREGDVVHAYRGKPIRFYGDLAVEQFVSPVKSTKPIQIQICRNGQEYQTTIHPVKTSKYLLGFDYRAADQPIEITVLDPASPLAEAGAKVGDVISTINGVKITSGDELRQYVSKHPLNGDLVELSLNRKGNEFVIKVTPEYYEYYYDGMNYYGNQVKVYGIKVVDIAWKQVIYWLKTTIKSVGLLCRGSLGMKDLSGPVGIINSIGTSVRTASHQGNIAMLAAILNWAIMISANLGVMNLLPLPALDGGRLVFLGIEAVAGKPFDRRKEGMIHTVGLFLLMGLMVIVLINDIRSIFLLH